MKGPRPKRQMNHLKGQTTRGTSSSQTSSVVRSISNKEKGGPSKKMPSLEDPSPITTTPRLKIDIAYGCCNIADTSYL
jgi:hypothetical protein